MTWIALLRGINVGGNNILPMKDLRDLLKGLGLQNVRTYIQSGNAVFESEKTDATQLGLAIADEIEKAFNFRPKILIISKRDLDRAINNNPYPEGTSDPKTLHLFFLSTAAVDANLSKLKELQKQTERFELIDRVFYLHAPEGIGRSKLAAQVEKNLGVAITARNLRSATKIAELAG